MGGPLRNLFGPGVSAVAVTASNLFKRFTLLAHLPYWSGNLTSEFPHDVFDSLQELVKALKPNRQRVHIASKCGMTGVDGKRVIDGRPSTLVKTLDEVLVRLQTDHIDLYYLHRRDKNIPIEESVNRSWLNKYAERLPFKLLMNLAMAAKVKSGCS